MSINDLWFLADCATREAEGAYHALCDRYEDFEEHTQRRSVSRRRFRTLAERIGETGAPYGAHTIVYRTNGDLLLVRHDGVDRWVVPGGEVGTDESFREAAERELGEEAGVDAAYEGLAMVTRVELRCGEHWTWGVLPVYAARAETTATHVADPDDEISAAEWFDRLPEDTRDRARLENWRERENLAV